MTVKHSCPGCFHGAAADKVQTAIAPHMTQRADPWELRAAAQTGQYGCTRSCWAAFSTCKLFTDTAVLLGRAVRMSVSPSGQH